MKKWWMSIFLSCLATLSYAQVLPLLQFGGHDTDNDPLLVREGFTPDSQNVITDDASGFSPRKGFVLFSTQTSKNEFVFPHGNSTRYIITQSSNMILANTGSGNFLITVGTVNPNVITCGAVLGNYFYYSNTVDGLKFWDASSSTIVSTSLKFTVMATHKGRLWGSGVPGDERTIYGSKLYDGTIFSLAIDPVETDPVRLTVQGALNENITALYASFRDLLIWSKPTSFGGIYGSRRSAFGSRSFSETIGTSYPESIQDCDGFLRFIGPRRTIWEFDGANIKKISEDIDTLLGTIVQGDLNSRTWNQTTADDWSKGRFGIQVSSDLSAGNVVFESTFNFVDTFDDGDYTTSPSWGGTPTSAYVENGLLYLRTGAVWTESNWSSGTWTITGNFMPLSDQANFIFMCPGNQSDLCTHDTERPAGYYLKFLNTGCSGSGCGLELNITLNANPDLGTSNENILISSTIPTLDPVKSISIFRTSTNTFVLSRNNGLKMGNTVTNTLFSSSSFMLAKANNGISAVSPERQYYDSITFEQEGTKNVMTSSFTSQSFNVGGNITSWGSFSETNNFNGRGITYRIISDTDTSFNRNDGTTFIASQTITNGNIPTIATAPYVTIDVSFTKYSTTETMSVNNFSVQWNEGSSLRVASSYLNQRYWLGVALSSTANNIVLVYNRLGKWDKYTGIAMDAAVIFNSKLMFGNASGIWQAESGTDDNGTAIEAYYTYKTIAPAGITTMSTFRDLYMTTTRANATLQTSYKVDGIDTSYSLPNYLLTTQDGYQSFNLPFLDTLPQQGKTISFKWTISSTVNWRVLGGVLDFVPDPIPSNQ